MLDGHRVLPQLGQAAINPSWDFAASGFSGAGQAGCQALRPRDTTDAIIWRAVYKNEALPVKQVEPKGEKMGAARSTPWQLRGGGGCPGDRRGYPGTSPQLGAHPCPPPHGSTPSHPNFAWDALSQVSHPWGGGEGKTQFWGARRAKKHLLGKETPYWTTEHLLGVKNSCTHHH